MIQTNINLDMFQAEFLVEKSYFFPAKIWMEMS